MVAKGFGDVGAAEGLFEAAAEDGEGGFEFVGGVEGEFADAGEGGIEAFRHVVEDGGEAVEFVAGALEGDAVVEVIFVDVFGGFGEADDWGEGAVDEPPANGAEEDERHAGFESGVGDEFPLGAVVGDDGGVVAVDFSPGEKEGDGDSGGEEAAVPPAEAFPQRAVHGPVSFIM